MDLTYAETAAAVADAPVVVPVGGRTQWETGNEAPEGVEVAAPSGVVRHDPADLTVTVAAGTPVGELAASLAEHGQECPLDPRSDAATVGGAIAVGVSGPRRLGYGPIRDRVLQVRAVLADGRVVKGGGPTVKNVSGYDLPRLFTGSFGTLGVLVEVVLRCQPIAPERAWFDGEVDPGAVRSRTYRPVALLWNGSRAFCLLEGHPDDVAAEAVACGLTRGGAPGTPDGPFRGRISVAPGRLPDLARRLSSVPELEWLAEVGVGTVHVATPVRAALVAARAAAHDLGGWLLREQGAGVDGFGVPLPNLGVMRRLKAALDPSGKLNPGRLPL